MDDFFLPGWAAVSLAGAAGAVMFAAIRPAREWKTALVGFLAGTAMAGVTTAGICELLNQTKVSIHLLVAFGVGLLGIVGCRATVGFFEADGTTILKEGFKRLFRIPDSREDTNNEHRIDEDRRD